MSNLSATLTPGKIFAQGETLTTAKLNQLGRPTVTIDGSDNLYGVDTGYGLPTCQVNIADAPAAYEDGLAIAFKCASANSGPQALQLNGLGAAPIRLNGAALTPGVLQPGGIYLLRYRLDGDLAQGRTYNNAGQVIVNSYIGATYVWSQGDNDTAVSYDGVTPIALTDNAFTATQSAVYLLGTANAPVTCSLLAQTGFWELVGGITQPPINNLYNALQLL